VPVDQLLEAYIIVNWFLMELRLETGALAGFCRTNATVLDCANGYQKEEVDEDKEDCRPEGEADREASAEK
jgi:hypothetical protein